MATNKFNAITEKRFLDELDRIGALTWGDKLAKIILSWFNSLDSLAASTVFEHCISYKNKKLTADSSIGKDFTDDSDAKLSTANTYKKTKTRECSVECDGKLGGIRIMAYESILNKFYYFCIPRNAYSKVIKIPFKLDGSPKRITNRGENRMWKYECKDYYEMKNKSF